MHEVQLQEHLDNMRATQQQLSPEGALGLPPPVGCRSYLLAAAATRQHMLDSCACHSSHCGLLRQCTCRLGWGAGGGAAGGRSRQVNRAWPR